MRASPWSEGRSGESGSGCGSGGSQGALTGLRRPHLSARASGDAAVGAVLPVLCGKVTAGLSQGPAPRRPPLPAAPLTGLRRRALGDPKAVHLAEVSGQEAHAGGGQDQGAQAPESALGGERRGADRVGLQGSGCGSSAGLRRRRPGGPTPSAPNQRPESTLYPQRPEGSAIQTSCAQDPDPRAPAPPRRGHAPRAHLDAAPLAAHAGRHVRGAASLPTELATRAGRQGPLPPVVEVRVLRRAPSAAPQAALPGLPQAPRTHVIAVPVLVALAAVAAGEGHTVGVNVQLTHWGAGRVRGPLVAAHRPCPPPARARVCPSPDLTFLNVWGPVMRDTNHPPTPTRGRMGTSFSASLPPSPPLHAGGGPAMPRTHLPAPHPRPAAPPHGGGAARAAEPRPLERGQAGGWRYLRSGGPAPPGPSGTRSRTCACRAPGGRSSGPPGPGRDRAWPQPGSPGPPSSAQGAAITSPGPSVLPSPADGVLCVPLGPSMLPGDPAGDHLACRLLRSLCGTDWGSPRV